MFRKGINLALVLVMVLTSSGIALAKADDGPQTPQAAAARGQAKSFIVVLTQDPVATYEGEIAGYEATKPGKGGKINPNSAHVRKYEKFLEKQQKDVLAAAEVSPAAQVNSYTFALNGFSALLTEAQVKALKAQPEVLLVLEDQMRYPQIDSSPTYLGLTDPGGAYLKGFTGEGVVVGIIDTGIWPEHPSFADDGSFPAPPTGPLPCEFGNTAHNPNDAAFECNNKLIGAYQMLSTYRALIGADPDEFDSARDDNGHGTHTASTSAGNAGVQASLYGMPLGTVSGIAPRAHVVAYKGLGTLGGFTSDLAAAIDQAVADGVDVINYSIGGGAGAPGADELAFLFAADAGVFVATSAGNSGSGAATLGNPGTMPWLTTVGASTQSRFFQGAIELGNGMLITGASLTPGIDTQTPLVDAEFAGGDLCTPGTLNPAQVSGSIVLCRRGLIARTDKSLAVYQAGGVGMIMYENTDDNNLFTDTHWVPSVHIDNTPGLAIKAYIASDPTPTARLVTGQIGEWPSAPSMTLFSSRGPNPVAPDIIKPDVTAPGIQILAGNTPVAPPSGELFQAIAGTSMSSPHVAGVFALIKQARPDWSAAIAKSALMTTAHQDVRDNDRVSQADPFDMGAGHIDPGGVWTKGSVVEPGLAYDAGFLEYLGFLCDVYPAVFANPAATCASLAGAGIPTKAYNLNYPSIGVANLAGSQTVMRTVTSVAKENGWRTYNVSVEAPAGYAVTVEPATISLKSGESATYAVTITNQSAAVGTWSFGSLTWHEQDGNYSVYSPIAVKAALFEAPAAISGSGAEGTASFNVAFGYSGAYSAAPHGLVPATVTMDNVVQDPDQTFDPNDGFSDLHQFNLSGVAQFRIILPPEATEADADLDVFVYNPNGVQVSSSTNGGTDEQIDIVLPMDGTWSVFVHGWAAPGGDSDYNLFSWAVPLAPGGSLNIDSAPAAATIGAIETIQVSWAGLGTGGLADWYLGAVSHTGPSGLLGLTLVEIDNR